MGFGGAPPWAVSAPDHDVVAWAWVQTRGNRPALSRRAGGRSSRQERKRLWAWLTRCVYFSFAGGPYVSECKDRLYSNKNTTPGIIITDRADASRRRLGSRGREQPSAGTSATGHGLHLSAGDGAHRDIERGKLGRWRRARRGGQASRAQHTLASMHASLDQAKHFPGAEWNHGYRVQGYITTY